MGRAAHRRANRRCTRQLRLSRITIWPARARSVGHRQRRAGHRNTQRVCRAPPRGHHALAAPAHRHRHSRDRRERRGPLHLPRQCGLGQHTLHPRDGGHCPSNARRVLGFACTAQRSVAPKHSALCRHRAQRPRPIQDIRHQPAPELLHPRGHHRVVRARQCA